MKNFGLMLLSLLIVPHAESANLTSAVRECVRRPALAKANCDRHDDPMMVKVCKEMDQAYEDSRVSIDKVRRAGTSDTKISFKCDEVEAKNLYEALKFYAKSERLRISDTGHKYLIRMFGNSSIPSQCSRLIESPDGQSFESYNCYIGIDLTDDVIKAW